jgi:hypothetical protein
VIGTIGIPVTRLRGSTVRIIGVGSHRHVGHASAGSLPFWNEESLVPVRVCQRKIRLRDVVSHEAKDIPAMLSAIFAAIDFKFPTGRYAQVRRRYRRDVILKERVYRGAGPVRVDLDE